MNDIERKERFFTQIMMDHKNEKLLNFLESDEIAEKEMMKLRFMFPHKNLFIQRVHSMTLRMVIVRVVEYICRG